VVRRPCGSEKEDVHGEPDGEAYRLLNG